MHEEYYRTQGDDEAGCTEQCQGCAMHQTLATGFRQRVQKNGECQDQFEQCPLPAKSGHRIRRRYETYGAERSQSAAISTAS